MQPFSQKTAIERDLNVNTVTQSGHFTWRKLELSAGRHRKGTAHASLWTTAPTLCGEALKTTQDKKTLLQTDQVPSSY